MNIILKNHQSVGDIIMLTAAVRDLKRWYPEFNIQVSTSCNTLFENNPYLCKQFPIGEPVIDIRMEYPLIHQLHNRDVHFLHGFIEFINEKLSLRVKLTEFKGDLYLTEEEMNWKPIKEPYWVVVAGGKSDFPAKIWKQESWQAVVDGSHAKCVTIGGAEHANLHPKLDGVIDMVGKTTIRQVLSLIHNSIGVVSPVTFAMHAAAALDKPAVVVAGGREHWYWEKYWNHTYLHTMGSLDCCRDAGCWKDVCANTTPEGHQKCLELINPEKVVEVMNGL